MFTKGFELTTALTNVIIFIVSLFCFFKTKDRGLWKFFFLLMVIDSFIGSVVHGFVMSTNLNNAIWVVLLILFAITVNTLLCIFIKCNYFHIAILSILLGVLLLCQMLFDMDYLLTFTLYVMVVFAVSTFFILEDKMKGYHFILLGFLVQLLGGVLMLKKVSFMFLNHNGICHVFTALTLICLYFGVNKKYKVC